MIDASVIIISLLRSAIPILLLFLGVDNYIPSASAMASTGSFCFFKLLFTK